MSNALDPIPIVAEPWREARDADLNRPRTLQVDKEQAVTKPLITLPKSFTGPVPGNSVFAEVASLGGDEFRWFFRKGRSDEITEFHRQARALASLEARAQPASEPQEQPAGPSGLSVHRDVDAHVAEEKRVTISQPATFTEEQIERAAKKVLQTLVWAQEARPAPSKLVKAARETAADVLALLHPEGSPR